MGHGLTINLMTLVLLTFGKLATLYNGMYLCWTHQPEEGSVDI